MPLVSVIIVNHNGKKYLQECVGSLRESSFKDFEIILVDNGSSDGSVAFLKEAYPEVKLLELGKNLGLSIASNRGVELAKGKYLFFFNNDTVADRELLAELVRNMESDSSIGICGCKTLTYDGANEINCGVEMDVLGYPYGKGRPFYVDAAIFVRKEVFNQIGGFDEKMFLYCEDRDFCWRTWLYGYKVVAVPTAIFKHDSACLVGGGEFGTNIKRRFMNEAFTLRMLLKNYGFFTLILVLPVYFLVNLFEIYIYLIKGKFKFVLNTYLSAYYWNLKNLKDTFNRRKVVQGARKIRDMQLMRNIYKISSKLLLFRKVGIPIIDSV